jgi:hypothetical protein
MIQTNDLSNTNPKETNMLAHKAVHTNALANPEIVSTSTRAWAGHFAKSAMTGIVLGAIIGHTMGNTDDEKSDLAVKVGLATGALFLVMPTVALIQGEMAPVVMCDDSVRAVATRSLGNALVGMLAGGAIAAAVPVLVYSRANIDKHDVLVGSGIGAATLVGFTVLGAAFRKIMPPKECVAVGIV